MCTRQFANIFTLLPVGTHTEHIDGDYQNVAPLRIGEALERAGMTFEAMLSELVIGLPCHGDVLERPGKRRSASDP